MSAQSPKCEAEKCRMSSIVGWGPKPMWLCQNHYEQMLAAAGRNITEMRTLLGKGTLIDAIDAEFKR